MDRIAAEDYDEFRDLWDGSGDWVLSRLRHDYVDLTIHFAGEAPTLHEIIAIRKTLPIYGEMQPSAVKEFLGEQSEIEVKRMSPSEAEALAERARQVGFSVSAVSYSQIGYLPVSRVQDVACIIEDNKAAQAVHQQMIEAGVPIVDTWLPDDDKVNE